MKATQARSCGTKQQYTKAEASAQAAWWRRRWLARMGSYHCEFCGRWHIGNAQPRRRRRVAR